MALRPDLEPGNNPVFSIPLSLINVPEGRVRSLKRDQAAAIGAAMDADGQYDAITIRHGEGNTFELIDGLHRLEGAKLVGWSAIDATVAPLSRLARRQEILSGWARADHDVFDKAAGVKALANMARATPDVADDQALECIPTSLRWDVEVANALHLGWSAVRKYLTVANSYSLDQVAILRDNGRSLDLLPLLRLAAKGAEVRAAVVNLIAGGFPGTLDDATEQVTGLVRDDDPIARATRATLALQSKWGSDAKGNTARANFFNEWTRKFHKDGRHRAAGDADA